MEKNIIQKLEKKHQCLSTTVKQDKGTKVASKAFDYSFNGRTEFYPWIKPHRIPKNFNIGVIYGASGSGKTQLLNEFGKPSHHEWENGKAIVSHFRSVEIALESLGAVGLNSIKTWCQDYKTLSTGERFRADLARQLKTRCIIDEFTSVVDRNVAKAASVAISKHIRRNNIKHVVIATCHEDVLNWLEPDWVINTNTGELYDGNFLNAQISISTYIQQQGISGPCLKTIII